MQLSTHFNLNATPLQRVLYPWKPTPKTHPVGPSHEPTQPHTKPPLLVRQHQEVA